MRRSARVALLGLLIAATPVAAPAFQTNGAWEKGETRLYIGNLSYWWGSELSRAANDWNKKTDFDFHILGDDHPACERYDPDGVLIYPFDQQPLMNGVEFNDTYCGEIAFEPGVLAVTQWVTDDNGFFDRAGLVFNKFYTWEVFHGQVGETTIDFHRVALHELGHFLGLGHETVNKAIMQPIISKIDELQPDDIAGAQSLYGAPPPAAAVLAPAALCRSRQLLASAKYCKRQLGCNAGLAKDASRNVAARDACIGTASGIFQAAWDKAVSEGAGACQETGAGSSMAPLVEAAATAASDQVGLGNAADATDRALRSSLMKQASALCNADFAAWQKEAAAPDAAKLTRRIDKARGRFVVSGAKAISKAAASGVSYDGAMPDAVADSLEMVANNLGEATAP